MQKLLVGYSLLIDQFNLKVIPHYRSSCIKTQATTSTTLQDLYEIHEYPKNYALPISATSFDQLEFALKYDGVNLEILDQFFKIVDASELADWISKRPTGKYTRMVWFLFEMLTGQRLELPDCKKIKHVDLLDPKKYFTANPIKSPRHGVNNNLLGNKYFCPFVRRTEKLEQYLQKQLDLKAAKIVQQYDPDIIERANNYLLTKETMSSYEIEHERPNQSRITKFINLLKKVEHIDHLSKEILIECQNTIVDHRFIDVDYRINQNYVGENINQYLQKIHFISPKPNDLAELMQGLLDSLERMLAANCPAVIIAAAISFGFVFLHPFEDGNGRLHRFLIHYILNRLKFSPPGITLPISAIILQNIRQYDAVLESFSKPLMEKLSDYHLNNEGVLTVKQESKHHYQYIDFTLITEYLFGCIEETIDVHFTHELDFLVNYDHAKRAIQAVVDIPDRLIDLLIRLILQNKGKIGKQKIDKYFSMLTESELNELTEIVTSHMLQTK